MDSVYFEDLTLLYGNKNHEQSSQAAKKFHDAILWRQGVPDRIVSYRDPHYNSKFWTELTEILNFKPII